MVISDFAIKKPLVTIVVMLSLVVFGIAALFQLDTDEFPEINPPILVVAVPYPGASPETVERELLDPIEESVQGLEGVDVINGSAQDSYMQLVVQFVFSKDPQEAVNEVRNAISGIRGDLPTEMEEPIIRRFSPNDFPIVQIALSSDKMTAADLTQLADNRIARELRSVGGVARVDVAGAQKRELSIELRPGDLAAAGISPIQVVQALQVANLAAPVGRVNSPGQEQSIRLEGRIENPDDFKTIPVGRGNGGRTVYLSEVADVIVGAEEARSLAVYNGRDAVGVNVLKASDASTTAVSEGVLSKIEQIQKELPAGVQLDVVQNSGDRVEASVENVNSTLVEGVLLTILVVFVFLNSWRSTVITGLALPVSMLAAFIAVWAFGFTLNTMSLLGLTLAIGIIIDDAIVVRENIVRHVEMGKDHLQASLEGTDEIGLAVAATTFAIVSVFVPIAFLPGIAGQWFKPFALTIASAVLVSLFVSFSLDPMLSAYWPEPHSEKDMSWFDRLLRPVTRALAAFNRWFDRQADRYRRVIGWALDHPVIVIMIATLSLVGAFALPATGLVKGGLFPTDDRSEFTLNVKTPPGSDIETTRGRLEQIAAIARQYPEVTYTFSSASSQVGAVDEGSVYVRLVPIHDRTRGAEDIAAEVRDKAARIPGLEVAIPQGMDGNQKAIQLQLRGPDRAALQAKAEEMLATVREVPGAVDVGLSTRGRKPELAVNVDRDAATAQGLSIAQIAQSLRPAFAGIDAGDWVDPDGETRDVYVRYGPEYRTDADALAYLPLRTAGSTGQGATVTLGEVATISDSRGPAIIEHVDGDPVVTIGANIANGKALSEVNTEINKRLNLNARGDTDLGDGVRLVQGGQTEAQTEIFGNMFLALGAGVMLMYLILVLQFGSFLDPIAILMSLPLSLIGVMLGLLVSGSTINIMSMIGVILLMGLVAKNAILLIDFAKEVKATGMSTRDALIEAGAIRLRPILMTTFALVAGMIPIAIGSGEGAMFRRPLGAAVIGGVITSTLLTLLVIPTIWELIDKGREGFLRLFRSEKSVKATSHADTAAYAFTSDRRES
ncbi:MAG: efflux RND transporter permease subunit [Bacteroidetes bacterium]|nr:efflux RND transporter permease subunit [Bacteroidota bacterium]